MKTASGSREKDSRNFLDDESMEFLRETIENNPRTSVHILPKEVAREVLTDKRLEIIETIRNEEISSKRDLSKKLDRDIKNVSEDLEILWEHSVIEFRDGKGTSKIPELAADRIVVEPF